MTQKLISIIVPAYNEEAVLDIFHARISEVLATLPDYAWEILFINDGSTDATQLKIEALQRHDPRVGSILLSRNFGKEAALCAGLEAAHGDAVVMLDSDMQHPPALLETFVRHWSAGADVVYAVRAHRDDESTFKRVGTEWFYNLINRGERFRMPPGAGDFRLMDRCVVDALMRLPERNRFMKGLYAWVGFESVAVPYVPEERAHGTSHFSKRRLVGLGLAGLTAFSVWPLRTVIAMGTVLALAALGYGAYLTVMYLLHGHDVSGWTTIVVSLMLFAGIQLLSLGVVAEYVGRIYEEVKGRPLHLVKRELGQGWTLHPQPRRAWPPCHPVDGR